MSGPTSWQGRSRTCLRISLMRRLWCQSKTRHRVLKTKHIVHRHSAITVIYNKLIQKIAMRAMNVVVHGNIISTSYFTTPTMLSYPVPQASQFHVHPQTGRRHPPRRLVVYPYISLSIWSGTLHSHSEAALASAV
jgi:hypothetical protein